MPGWEEVFKDGCPVSANGSADAGNAALLKNQSTDLLATYLGNAIGVFKCPSDPRYCIFGGQTVPVVRSCSANQGVGTVDTVFAQSGSGHGGRPASPSNGPWLDGNHGHKSGGPYATFGKSTSFRNCSPSDIWVYVDDDPWTINDAAMAVIAAVPDFVDYPSPMHKNACGFAFADGHSEVHKWKSNLFVHTGVPPRTTAQPGAQYSDWFWWASHATRSFTTGTVP